MKACTYGSLSVIVPCHNAGKALAEAVESVLFHPTRLEIEVVIVDDSSSDRRTVEIADGLTSDNRVRLVRNEVNLGVQRARNLGLEAARSDLVMALDADDKILNPQSGSVCFFDEAADILGRDLGVAFVHTRSKMFGDFKGLTISSYPVQEHLVVRKHHVPTSIIYRRAEIDQGCRYDSAIGKWQDWSYGVEILARRWQRGLDNRVGYHREPAHGYRVHNEVARVSSRRIDELEMVRKTVARHWGYFQQFYPGHSVAEVAATVLSHKPDRLTDLLYMAAWDVHEALAVASAREYGLATNLSLGSIP